MKCLTMPIFILVWIKIIPGTVLKCLSGWRFFSSLHPQRKTGRLSGDSSDPRPFIPELSWNPLPLNVINLLILPIWARSLCPVCVHREASGQWQSVLRQPQHTDDTVGRSSDPRVRLWAGKSVWACVRLLVRWCVALGVCSYWWRCDHHAQYDNWVSHPHHGINGCKCIPHWPGSQHRKIWYIHFSRTVKFQREAQLVLLDCERTRRTLSLKTPKNQRQILRLFTLNPIWNGLFALQFALNADVVLSFFGIGRLSELFKWFSPDVTYCNRALKCISHISDFESSIF